MMDMEGNTIINFNMDIKITQGILVILDFTLLLSRPSLVSTQTTFIIQIHMNIIPTTGRSISII